MNLESRWRIGVFTAFLTVLGKAPKKRLFLLYWTLGNWSLCFAFAAFLLFGLFRDKVSLCILASA